MRRTKAAGGGAPLTSLMISKLSHFLLLLVLLSCVPSPLCPPNNPQISSQNRHHKSGMEPRHANKSPPPPTTTSLIVPRFCRGGRRNSIMPRDDKFALRSDAKCASKIPGRIRRGQNRDTTTIQTALICHTHKQALSVFHHENSAVAFRQRAQEQIHIWIHFLSPPCPKTFSHHLPLPTPKQ